MLGAVLYRAASFLVKNLVEPTKSGKITLLEFVQEI